MTAGLMAAAARAGEPYTAEQAHADGRHAIRSWFRHVCPSCAVSSPGVRVLVPFEQVATGEPVRVAGTVLAEPLAESPRRDWCRVALDSGTVLEDVRVAGLVPVGADQ